MLADFAVLTGAALIALGTGLAFAGIVRATLGPRTAAPTGRRSAGRASVRPASLDDYGLLRTVVLVENLDTGRSVRDLLGAGGVRATISTGQDRLTRVLVFPHQYDEARRMVSWVL